MLCLELLSSLKSKSVHKYKKTHSVIFYVHSTNSVWHFIYRFDSRIELMVDYVHPTIQQLVEPPLAATTSAVFYMTLSKSPMDVKESLIFSAYVFT